MFGWKKVEMNLICVWPRKTLFHLDYFKINTIDPLGYFRAEVNWKEMNSVRNFLNSPLTFKA